jgi:hypothetical protein
LIVGFRKTIKHFFDLFQRGVRADMDEDGSLTEFLSADPGNLLEPVWPLRNISAVAR